MIFTKLVINSVNLFFDFLHLFRYAFKTDLKTMIEVHLQKVRVLIITKAKGVVGSKFIQFSRYDTVGDFYKRAMEIICTSDFILWKLVAQNTSLDLLLNNIQKAFEGENEFLLDAEQIKYNTQNIMTLNIDSHSLLIIEKLSIDGDELDFQTLTQTYQDADVDVKNDNINEEYQEENLQNRNKILGQINADFINEEVKTETKSNRLELIFT